MVNADHGTSHYAIVIYDLQLYLSIFERLTWFPRFYARRIHKSE